MDFTVTTKQKKTLKQKDTTNKTKTTKATHTKFPRRRKSVAKGIVVNVTSPCGLALDLYQVLAFQTFFPFRFLPFKFLPFKSSFLSGSCLSSSCLSSSCVCIQCCPDWTQEHARTTPRNQNTSAGPHISATRVYRDCHAYCKLRLDMMTSSCTTPAKHHTLPHHHEGFAKRQNHLPKVFLSSVTVAFKTRTLIEHT